MSALTVAGHPWTFWLGWAWSVSSVIVTTWIVMQRRAPQSTLAWIIVVNLLPVIGLPVYAYFGPQRITRQRLKRWHTQASLMSQRDLQTLRAHRPDRVLILPWNLRDEVAVQLDFVREWGGQFAVAVPRLEIF